MSITVSIIEDDDEIRNNLNEIIKSSTNLSLQGSAKNGSEARKLINEDETDVYLIDLGLPDVDGVELIESIKKNCKKSQVFVITTFGDEKHLLRSIRAGASGYLLKVDICVNFHEKIILINNGYSIISETLVKSLFKEINSNTAMDEKKDKREYLVEFCLAPREIEVLKKLVTGAPIFNIACDIGISAHTVNQHLRSIYRKFNVHSRAMAVSYAIKNGFHF